MDEERRTWALRTDPVTGLTQPVYASDHELAGEPIVETAETICKYCGATMLIEGGGGWKSVAHPGGPCGKAPIMSAFGEDLTLQEYRALVRVARAQIELEKRRGREG